MLLLLFLMTSPSYACMRVTPPTPGMPATPCKTCTPLTPTQAGQGAKPMDPPDGVIDMTGACTVVTYTCKGPTASIGFWDLNGVDTSITDDDAISASLTCNAAGTAWEYEGVAMSRIECVATAPYACATCTANQLTVRVGEVPEMVEMDSDMTTKDCKRTFKCEGMSVDLYEGDKEFLGEIFDKDPNDPTLITVTVVCAADGSGWVLDGEPQYSITSVACIREGPPKCSMCKRDLIAKMEAPPATTFPDITAYPLPSACAVRTFKCEGANARIEYVKKAGGPKEVINGVNMLAEFAVTCNDDATAWEYPAGMPITAVWCYHD